MSQPIRTKRNTRGASPAFTLVEVLWAVLLGVFVMLGIVQVFKMSTEAVSEAKSISDAYQTARGVLSMLDQDFAQQTREGYVALVPGQISLQVGYDHSADFWIAHGRQGASNRHWANGLLFDQLILTCVGRYEEIGTAATDPAVSGGAEVLYGPGCRLGEAGTSAQPWLKPDTRHGDPRRMLLCRKPFLLGGVTAMSPYSQEVLPSAEDVAPGGVGSPNSTLNLMMADRWTARSRGMSPKYRLTPARPGDWDELPQVRVVPTRVSQGYETYEPNVNWVIADNVSEFFVEFWAMDRHGEWGWQRPMPNSGGYGSIYHQYLWCGHAANVADVGHDRYRRTPPALRVTVVVHPHNDVTLFEKQRYCTRQEKYRGYVFRQVFRVNGVLMNFELED